MIFKRTILGCAIVAISAIVSAAKAQQIIQITSGWCSPTVANVVGDVVIKCIGVPPPVHRKLTEKLARLKDEHQLEVQQLVAEANEWVKRYNEVNERLGQLTGKSVEAQEIRQLLANGKLEDAAGQLDIEIKRYEKQIETLAEYHYLRAIVAALSFEINDATRHLRLSHEYQPQNQTYLLAYASNLIHQGRFVDAQHVIKEALPGLRARARTGSIKENIILVDALDKLGMALISTDDVSEVDAISNEALSVAERVVASMEEDDSISEEIEELMSKAMYSIGRNNFVFGRFEKSEMFLTLAFSWILNLCSKKSVFYCGMAAQAATITGYIDVKRENYARGLGRYQLALDTLKWIEGTSGPRPNRAKILILSANASFEQKRIEVAEKYYREVLDTWREGEYLTYDHRVSLARAYNRLGLLALNREQYAKGVDLLHHALAFTSERQGTEIVGEWAMASMSIARMYITQGNGTDALQYAIPVERVLRSYWEDFPNENSSIYAESLHVLGLSQWLSGKKENGCATLSRVGFVEPGGVWDKASVEPLSVCMP